MIRRSTRLGRRSAAALLTAAATALPLLIGAAPAQAAETEPAARSAYRDKTESGLLRQLATRDEATFWVALKAEADVSSAHRAKGKAAKARAVLETKSAFARKSQAGVIELARKAERRTPRSGSPTPCRSPVTRRSPRRSRPVRTWRPSRPTTP